MVLSIFSDDADDQISPTGPAPFGWTTGHHLPKTDTKPPSLVCKPKHDKKICNFSTMSDSPLVACSNWKRVMFVLKKGKPYDDPSSISKTSVHEFSKLRYLTQFNSTERKWRMMNYTKFMFVRDPFVCLISAYRSKFLYKQKNTYLYKNYGKIMIKRYKNQPNPPQTLKEAEELGLLPTFNNFIQYLVDPQTERREPFEPHWRQMYRLCHPCLIEYDFIGHQENLQEDAQELLKLLKLENDIKFPSAYENVTTSNSVMDWFKTVPLEDRRKLFDIYKWDFKLFGYKRPDSLLDG
ncbi:PREDICTED: carbohydrate sulfotransferase 12-like [Cyprinodon variegatus]|uniref:carbohydrate sulfotransferase 12-like n=1 Tax=Cyprinodon variegatus TaxID=28743 RepID=UPI0007425358|nr:PREDICTED: carbohydrate sulfotransferase 12-like [Cyprinodon variegatus]